MSEGRTELMLWSAVHGYYARLLISGEIGEGCRSSVPPATSVIPWLGYDDEEEGG